MLLLAIVKIIDNLILTAKSIATYRNKAVLSAFLVAVSQVLFYLVIDKVVSADSLAVIFVVSFASGIGTYIAFKISNRINERFKKDVLYTNLLTCSSKEDIENLCTVLRQNNIKYMVNFGYTRKWQITYNVIAFCLTKKQSNVIDTYLKLLSTTPYLRQILKEK